MSVLQYLIEELDNNQNTQDTEMNSEKESKILNAINKFKSKITKDSIPNFIKKIESGMSKMNPKFKGQVQDVLNLIGMLNDWVTGAYRELPWETVLTLVAALIYVVSPIDVIPDVIPVAGWADDAFVVSKILPAISKDAAKYKEWKNNQ